MSEDGSVMAIADETHKKIFLSCRWCQLFLFPFFNFSIFFLIRFSLVLIFF
jgi:hypothetical protein